MAIDEELMEAAGFLPGEMIHVLNITNAQRLVTYAITAPAGSGTLELRGAAARLGQVNDEIIILSYCQMDNEEAKNHTPTVVRVTEGNKLKKLQ
jgi:aspartate 1-decarboxylase